MPTTTGFLGSGRVQALRVVAVLLLAFSAGLTMSALTGATGEEGISQSPKSASLRDTFDDDNPLATGEKISLSEAEARVDYDLLRPNDSLASDATMTTVWASEIDQLAFQYESGVDVLIYQGILADEEEARVRFDRNAKYWQGKGVDTYVTTIGGAPALVSLGNVPGRAPAILIQIGPTTVEILGGLSGISEEEILRIAASVNAYKIGQGL